MIITKTITKKILENIVHQTFSKFGSISSSSLLDSLKLLGFHYATNAGISINIEDLKTPDSKKSYIATANKETQNISKLWQQGFVSDTERFQSIIDSWNVATESLKNRIIDYYKNYDPANNLYIMAFSGARGNMSQVRQLVGMRGLMSDQEGKIIDLPIQTNFREGLSSIDYIISSYGARKGIVDTALKTADSGYLTRRLIYIAQDLIIRQKDCNTKKGIIFLLTKNTSNKNILGRTLLSKTSLNNIVKNLECSKSILTEKLINQLKKETPVILNVSSALTCTANGSICQNCYGWDLAQEKIISLGEAVGIIAAQSIGEPGTQLTMRTFHTGGIFTGEVLRQIVTPFSGKIIIPNNLKTISYRTNHGNLVLKLQQEVELKVVKWNGELKNIFLEIGSFLYVTNSSFVRKNQLIAESTAQSILPGARKLKPIYSLFGGEVRFENLLVRKILKENRTLKVNQEDGILWLSSGKIFSIPKEVKYLYQPSLSFSKPIAHLKLVIPYQGIFQYKKNVIQIIGKENKYILNLSDLKKKFPNVNLKISITTKNYQYIDRYTVIGLLYFFPQYEAKIYSIRRKEAKYITTLFFITEEDIWKIHSDQVNNFLLFQDKRMIVRSGMKININSKILNNGFFLKRDGFKMIFQNAIPIFLSQGTILNYKQGDFVFDKKILATLVNYTQQTEDIVQGLPKIEELVEARKPKVKSYLALRPGVLLNNMTFSDLEKTFIQCNFENNFIKCFLNSKEDHILKSKRKQEKQIIYLNHSIYLKSEIVLFNNQIFKALEIPSIFKPIKKSITNEFVFKNCHDKILLINGKPTYSTWTLIKLNSLKYEYEFLKYKNKKLYHWLSLSKQKDIIFKNKRGDLMLIRENKQCIFLEYLTPILEYSLPITSKLIQKPGNFIDIGEPITEGIIDIHELLQILFRYHSIFDGLLSGTYKSVEKFQLILINSILSIYYSQGVTISSKHIEIIVKQMTSKVVIKESGDTPLLPGELIRLSLLKEIYFAFIKEKSPLIYKTPRFEPILRSATNSSLSKDGFLSAAGFQETKRVLTKAAIEGTTDWLRGLKECIIIGRIIPAGSSFLNYKNYLDNIYLFKN